MRLLHTSDWHAGRTTYNQSRAADLDNALAEIVDIARTARPDLIVNSGDLIDHVRVSHAEVERVVEALVELAGIAPTVVVAGNHDSASLMRSFHQLGHLLRLHFISDPVGLNGNHLTFGGRDGVTLRLGALPFVYAQRSIAVFDDPRTWAGNYRGRIATLQSAIAQSLNDGFDPRKEVSVFAAHLHVTGAGLSGSERRGHVSDDYASDPETMPAVNYAAFGHIHEAQPVPGRVPGRYAGSPIPLDFGEAGHQKSVTLVNLEPGRPTQTELIPLRGGRNLVQFTGTLEELQRDAENIADALCLITVHTPTHDPALSQRIHDLVPRATVLQVQQRAADSMTSAMTVEPGGVRIQRPLQEAFDEYLRTTGTRTASAATVSAMFAEFLAAADLDREPTFEVEAFLAAHTCSGAHS